MKKVICFSLWGDNPKYTIGAIKNALLAEEIFPDWICRYYVGKSTPLNIIQNLKKIKNTEIVLMDEDGDWTGMFWRFYAASDSTVDVMISRDTDSRLSYREKAAVDEWLNSNKMFHIMRDNLGHCIEIMGGMWGVKHPALSEMISYIKSYTSGNYWQIDQQFLSKEIYPRIKNNCMIHDEYFNFEKIAKNFPTPRFGDYHENGNAHHYVGKAYFADDNSDDGICWKKDKQ